MKKEIVEYEIALYNNKKEVSYKGYKRVIGTFYKTEDDNNILQKNIEPIIFPRIKSRNITIEYVLLIDKKTYECKHEGYLCAKMFATRGMEVRFNIGDITVTQTKPMCRKNLA